MGLSPKRPIGSETNVTRNVLPYLQSARSSSFHPSDRYLPDIWADKLIHLETPRVAKPRLVVHRSIPAGRPSRIVGRTDPRNRPPTQAPGSQGALDRITSLAGEMLDVGLVCATLVDAQRRLVASSYGLAAPLVLLLSYAFRKRVVMSRRPLIVVDGQRDAAVADLRAVRDGSVQACVGLPLEAADGRPIGTLLVMDQQPRQWTAGEMDVLHGIAALIVCEMELRAAVRRASRRSAAPLKGIAT